MPKVLGLAAWRGQDTESFGLPLDEYRNEFQLQNPIFEEICSKFPWVKILDPTEQFVNTSKKLCRVAEGGKSLYMDEGHLSSAGAMLLRPLFEPIFKEMHTISEVESPCKN